MSTFKNEFSWSKSRADKFNTCLRKYYLHHYGSWGGWERDADPVIREIYIMKNLSSLPMWIGASVHRIAEGVINRARSKHPISLHDALTQLRTNMDMDWQQSSSGQFRRRPNRMLGLQEHYYGEVIPENAFEESFQAAERCIQNLYQKSIYQELLADCNWQIVETEQLETIDVRGVKVWVVADLILQKKDHLKIVDWKTGKDFGGEGIETQLAIYALYGANKWGLSPEHVTIHQSNLRLGHSDEKIMTIEKINWVAEYITSSAAHMKALLDDPIDNVANKVNFPMTEQIHNCCYCNFRRVCDREAQ